MVYMIDLLDLSYNNITIRKELADRQEKPRKIKHIYRLTVNKQGLLVLITKNGSSEIIFSNNKVYKLDMKTVKSMSKLLVGNRDLRMNEKTDYWRGVIRNCALSMMEPDLASKAGVQI
jgi:hypothetical protein